MSARIGMGCSPSPLPPLFLPSQYSFSLTTFSPSGKLVQVRVANGRRDKAPGPRAPRPPPPPHPPLPPPQIEHALNAVAAGATSLGIRAVDGVVLATEKKARSPLIDGTTVKKLSPVTPNCGLAYAGMGPDSRVLARRARKSAQVRAEGERGGGGGKNKTT